MKDSVLAFMHDAFVLDGMPSAGGGRSAVYTLHSLDAANAAHAAAAIGDAHRDAQTRTEGAAEVFHLVA